MSEDPWSLNVTRLCGQSYMRPEKAWRPVLTIDAGHVHHEVVLGVKGENPNMKQTISLHDPTVKTPILFQVWKKAETKKKTKKRTLVASAEESLLELLKKQTHDKTFPQEPAEVRLSCQSQTRKRRSSQSSKGKPQNGCYICVTVKPPLSFKLWPLDLIDISADDELYHSEATPTSHAPTTPGMSDGFPVPTEEELEGLRKRHNPFSIDSDDEQTHSIFDEPSIYREDKPPPNYFDDANCAIDELDHGVLRISWASVAASILPTTMTEKIPTSNSYELEHWWERTLAKFTLYRNFKFAQTQEEFQQLQDSMKNEWSFAGGALAALCGMSTAVFTLTPDSLFPVNPFARATIGMSGLLSAVGIFMVFWYWLRFNWADVETFNYRAMDLYGTFFFFCLTSKVPLLSAILAALCLLTFIANVAYNVWPLGSLIVCFFFGVVLSLQFLIYGIHWTYVKIAFGIYSIYRRVKGLFSNPETKPSIPSNC
ncbi:hypothetical protein DL96DRAFT_1555608 [Flagelloscypha sp. PMI_526]|nr:hypothetical protein DL96DRAFT_1555608 [Flagelloscypha sp. PMI_526]